MVQFRKMASLKYVDKAPADPPLLAVFSGGNPAALSDPNFKFQAFKSARSKEQVVFAEGKQTYFYGSTASDDAICRPRYNFAIGVHKHGKNAVKVIATSPLFSVTERHVDDAKRELDPSIVEQDFDSTRSALTERFGSVKRRRELRSQEASKFDVDSHSGSAQAAQSALDSAAATVPTSEETDAERALLPPYDALTTDESKIYKFSDMVPTTLWRALPTKPLINPMQSREELSDMYPSFVIMNLDRIKTLEGEEQRQVSRLLMYFNFLMRMYREHRTDTLAYNIACDPELGEFLAQTFTGTSKGRITKEHKAKIIAHLCVIALNASDSCQVDGEEIQSIATDLKLTVSELLPYFRAVGCPNASKMRCKLVAPLKLPDVGGFKSRRG